MREVRGIHHVLCPCGKEIYYSLQAAEYALRDVQRKGMLDPSRKECRIYPCHLRKEVWHLTSISKEDYWQCQRKSALCAIREWGVKRRMTIIVPANKWRLRVNRNPYRGTVVIRKAGK